MHPVLTNTDERERNCHRRAAQHLITRCRNPYSLRPNRRMTIRTGIIVLWSLYNGTAVRILQPARTGALVVYCFFPVSDETTVLPESL